MTTSISNLAAKEHVADLRRTADRRRAPAGAPAPSAAEAASATAVSLRIAGVEDEQVVRDLAALDDAPALQGDALVALVDGEAVAALSLRDGRVVANPFVHTAAAVALLRVRAKDLSGRSARRRRRPFILRPRFA